MLTLAIVAALVAASSAAPGPRMPGLALRFGETVAAVDSTHAWEIDIKAPKGKVVRKGPARFFGVPADVKLFFEDGVLARAEAKADSAAPAGLDYVRDQLRLAGFQRSCTIDDPDHQQCTWTGRAAVVTLDIQGLKLTATIERPAPPAPVALAPDSAGARADSSARAPAPPFAGAPPGFELDHPEVAKPWPAPEVAQRAKPALPQIAREAGVFGRVLVRASVDSTGAVTSTEVLRSIPMLDAAAVACVKQWRFKPYAPAGRPIAFRITIPVLMVLD